jgi:hypothetical protein
VNIVSYLAKKSLPCDERERDYPMLVSFPKRLSSARRWRWLVVLKWMLCVQTYEYTVSDPRNVHTPASVRVASLGACVVIYAMGD